MNIGISPVRKAEATREHGRKKKKKQKTSGLGRTPRLPLTDPADDLGGVRASGSMPGLPWAL